MPLTIRLDIWEKLPENYQAIISSAAKEAQDMDRDLVAKQTTEYVELLKEKKMEINYPDLTEFAEATQGVMHVFSDVYGKELIGKIRDVYDS